MNEIRAISILNPKQNGQNLVGDIFKYISLNDKRCILIHWNLFLWVQSRIDKDFSANCLLPHRHFSNTFAWLWPIVHALKCSNMLLMILLILKHIDSHIGLDGLPTAIKLHQCCLTSPTQAPYAPVNHDLNRKAPKRDDMIKGLSWLMLSNDRCIT